MKFSLVIIADPSPIWRIGAKGIIKKALRCEVVDTNRANDVLQHRDEATCVLINLQLTKQPHDGVKLANILRQQENPPNVVMVGDAYKPVDFAQSLAVGAKGYIDKSIKPMDLTSLVATLISDKPVELRRNYDMAAKELTEIPQELVIEGAPPIHFTPREHQILRCLSLGMSTLDISAVIKISSETVKDHIQKILRKTGFAYRTQIATMAVRNGCTPKRIAEGLATSN